MTIYGKVRCIIDIHLFSFHLRQTGKVSEEMLIRSDGCAKEGVHLVGLICSSRLSPLNRLLETRLSKKVPGSNFDT